MDEKILKILIIDAISAYKIIPTQETVDILYTSLTSNYGTLFMKDGSWRITQKSTFNLQETILYIGEEEITEFLKIKDYIKYENIPNNLEDISIAYNIPLNRLNGDINCKPPEYIHFVELFYQQKLAYIIGFISQHTHIEYEKEPEKEVVDTTAEQYFEEKIRAFVESKLSV